MIECIIFDMDGVLVDTEPVYQNMVREFLSSCQVHVCEAELMSLVGVSHKVFQQKLAQWWERDKAESRDPLELDRLFESYCDSYPCDYPSLLNPGAAETLQELSRRQLKTALASSSPMRDIQKILSSCRLENSFSLVVSGEQFKQSKPDPEIYLYTMQKLRLPAACCIAVEDSPPGILAARRAGIRVIAKQEQRFGFSQDEADGFIREIPELLSLLD